MRTLRLSIEFTALRRTYWASVEVKFLQRSGRWEIGVTATIEPSERDTAQMPTQEARNS